MKFAFDMKEEYEESKRPLYLTPKKQAEDETQEKIPEQFETN